MTRHERVFRLLLRAYPVRFRADYGDEMVRLFREQLRDAQQAGSRLAIAELWVATVVDVVTTAPVQRLQRERRVAEPIEPGTWPAMPPRKDRSFAGVAAIGLLPLWTYLMFVVMLPAGSDAYAANPPAVAGLPAGVVGLVAAFGWMTFGLALLFYTVSDAARVIIYLAFTIPAAALVMFMPALILLVQNLGE